MSKGDVNNFLNALEALKKDYTCVMCSELCSNPVRLSKCFHMICSQHFNSLKTCPKCDVSLEGCTVYCDDKLASCVISIQEIDKMFYTYKTDISFFDKNAPNQGDIKKTKKKVDSASGSIVIENKIDYNLKRNEEISLASNTTNKLNKTLEKRNHKGETMLHVACRLGKIDKIAELLGQGANTNTKDNAGWTPLHEAVQNGRIDIVRTLLEHNTLINVPGPSNETPLHEAVRYNYEEIAQELVRNGADMYARNCKGETPVQLAKGVMKEILKKASENIIQTQSLNISHISALHVDLDFDNIRVYSISVLKNVHNKLKLLIKHHNNMVLEAKFTKKVTHLVVDVKDDICTSSVEVLQAIVNGIWIVSTEWVLKCTQDKLESFDTYEVKGVGTSTYKGPTIARYNKYKQLPGIFNGCHFYLHNFNTKYEVSKTMHLTKPILCKLITEAGGIVLRRAPNPECIPESEKLVPYHAKNGGKLMICSHYIIYKDNYEPMYNMKHLKALPIGWLIECLERYELCEPW